MVPGRLLDGRMKIRHLHLVTAIAEAGSLVGAAESLHITQPVVTRGLREVEDILGVQLFERLPRGVRPSVYGASFLTHAYAVLGQLRSADKEVQLLASGELGTVVVGTHFAGASLLLPRAIAAFKSDHPNVLIAVQEAIPDQLEKQLLAGDLDLVVGRLTPPHTDRVRQVRLHDEPFRVVTRLDHPAHDVPEPSLADLASYPWIVPVAQIALRAELERVFESQHVAFPVNRVECTSVLTLRQLLIASDMVTVLPHFVATQDPALKALSTRVLPLRRSVGVTVSTERPGSPATSLFLDRLVEEAEAMAQQAEPD
jgi:DNA-binding transcriptional LysR family regulator